MAKQVRLVIIGGDIVDDPVFDATNARMKA